MKLNAKAWSFVSAALVLLLALLALLGYRLFVATYQGWLIESIPDSGEFIEQIQGQLNELADLQHPSVIHIVPAGCPCTLLTLSHAQKVTESATHQGYSVYQSLSSYRGLGEQITDISVPIAPIIVFTRDDGSIAYAGAYSDGLRCTEANSLVDQFLDFPELLPAFAVAGLDVNVCRCIQ